MNMKNISNHQIETQDIAVQAYSATRLEFFKFQDRLNDYTST